MSKTLFLGDEAVAQAALDAGLSGVYAYPGTPSTEITEFIQNSKQGRAGEVHSIWAGNEKTAMESAIGMSYAGKRSMVCMKHVGLNVAADPFMNASITGANGGMVVVVADDPSMHSSQDEQDSRYYAKFALIPSFEPSNQQEAYDITYAAFDYSEKYHTPVLIRLTTRLSHSRAGVERKAERPQTRCTSRRTRNSSSYCPPTHACTTAPCSENRTLLRTSHSTPRSTSTSTVLTRRWASSLPVSLTTTLWKTSRVANVCILC